MTRRRFIVGAAATGGLLVGAPVLGLGGRASALSRATPGPVVSELNAWVQIGTDESITIFVASSEMGQGVLTGLPQVVAEELRVAWASVTTAPPVTTVANTATTTNPYNNPFFGSQATGGSTSVAAFFVPMQQAGAAARTLLVAAAAAMWGVKPSACAVANGAVHLVADPKRSATYGQLAAAASLLPAPAHVTTTPPSKWTLIGTSAPRKDLHAKTTGAAVYGIDVRVPGMVYAAIAHSPSIGGKVATLGPAPAGALSVVNLGGAVAVVASSTWQAMKLLGQVKVTWTPPPGAAAMTDQVIATEAQKLMQHGPAIVADGDQSALSALTGAAKSIDRTYSLPYVPHACMEVLNATALVDPGLGACEIWAPTQSQSATINAAASVLGIDLAASPTAVKVHTTFLGGGLGRKGETDFVVEAVQIAATMPGVPVHLTWSREQDFGHDQWRPMALLRVRAGIDGSNTPVGWVNRIVSPSIFAQKGYGPPPGTADPTSYDGAANLAYGLGRRLVDVAAHPSPVPVSFWRSVGNSINAFGVESAIDELATVAGVDPLLFREQLLTAGHPGPDRDRLLGVLAAVGAASGWTTPPPAGVGRGVAIGKAMSSYVAEVAEVSASASGGITVTGIWCAVDCGVVINPDIVVAQMEGGIIHGLNAAMFGGSSFAGGRASPNNFDEYRMLRMREAPPITVTIVPSSQPPTGVGEPGVPYIAPAVANAWAALTGVRKRSLPLA